MLQKLSYINLFFAIIYLLAYLKSGTFNSTSGIFVIIIFNWLALRSYQLEHYKWQIWHYFAGFWSLYFVSTLFYSSFNIVAATIEFNFITNDTLFLLLSRFTLCMAVIFHFWIYIRLNFKKEET